ncbi:type III secretion system translocon subunit SctE [Parendozoicomonas sp. Alg238-R29]|uniref:type III secretion system translocon subunit SctE n=1 Tax=Parendozoicomonas sp. Alg238-R29 TaxID=2993446 RepID=UPI00248EE50B|nr:type III secretion system translocon subunit SctE [Parendozoicomonas sp. Alg238-R29]
MSNTGGVSANHGAGVQLPPGLAGKEGSVAGKAGHAGKSKSGKAQAAEHVARGFSNDNSVSHKEGRAKAERGARTERAVRLPNPKVDPGRVTTPDMQAQIAQSMDTTEMLFTFDELLNQLNAESEELESGETAGSSTVYGASRKKKAGQGEQGNGNDSGGRHSGGQQSTPDLIAGAASTLAQGTDAKTLTALQDETLHTFDKVLAIKSAPPELLAELKGATEKLSAAMLTGNVEDIARMLSEIQTKLQDTRLKFDEQAIRTSRLKRSQIHESRIGKLAEAMKKMKEAKKKVLIGKIFGGIATALAVIVAAATIATGVGAKAGVMLIMAATVMVAMTVSQNSGDWMTNMGGLIKDDKAQLAMGIMWAVLAAALSLGAGMAGGTAKASSDVATTAVQQGANASSQAAQQGANVGAQGAQQGANAASQSAQQAAQHSATAVQNTAKTVAKTATDTADEAAEQSVKVAVKSSQQATKEAAKGSADVAKGAAKETANQSADIAKKTMYYQRAAHIARFTEGGAMAADGGATMHAAKLQGEAGEYQADATEDLAYLTKLQLMMEDWTEAIQRTLQEISEGQQIASDMLSQAQQSKFNITRNI